MSARWRWVRPGSSSRCARPAADGPVLVAAHELLDQLYAETERLLREKEPAVHHLAKALIERDELIGDELEAVFAEVERGPS